MFDHQPPKRRCFSIKIRMWDRSASGSKRFGTCLSMAPYRAPTTSFSKVLRSPKPTPPTEPEDIVGALLGRVSKSIPSLLGCLLLCGAKRKLLQPLRSSCFVFFCREPVQRVARAWFVVFSQTGHNRLIRSCILKYPGKTALLAEVWSS